MASNEFEYIPLIPNPPLAYLAVFEPHTFISTSYEIAFEDVFMVSRMLKLLSEKPDSKEAKFLNEMIDNVKGLIEIRDKLENERGTKEGISDETRKALKEKKALVKTYRNQVQELAKNATSHELKQMYKILEGIIPPSGEYMENTWLLLSGDKKQALDAVNTWKSSYKRDADENYKAVIDQWKARYKDQWTEKYKEEWKKQFGTEWKENYQFPGNYDHVIMERYYWYNAPQLLRAKVDESYKPEEGFHPLYVYEKSKESKQEGKEAAPSDKAKPPESPKSPKF